ncbi:Hypothetical predicted protein [Mytilus galloprovincialis]|uniref:Uncharacterized protein n=1 Tax=Mytilus galloprovincialis TaxID=29158 RepID=A0A8B6G6E9_MYTGA|nr:Hypothetical predicted protein [Mytilus galloprovincialis]
MNTCEKQIICSYRHTLQKYVDPIIVVDGLYQVGHFSANQRKQLYNLLRTYSDRQYIWDALYVLMLEQCKLQSLLEVLLVNGYRDVAIEMSQKVRIATPQQKQILRIHRTKTGNSSHRFAQRLFMNFKINTHNNAFINPRKYCHEESQKYKLQLDRCQSSEDDTIKTEIADKYAACLLAEIDSHLMLYTKNSFLSSLMIELQRLIPNTTNSSITHLSYQSRLAIRYALEGKHYDEEEHLQSAICTSVLVGRCVEISNLLYIYAFNLLCRYEKYPIKNLRDKVIHIAELGLQSVDEEDESIREFWMRLFIIRIIYCLLGLSFRGDPISGITIDKHSISRAKLMLSEIDRLWERIESRRKIMYYVAKARVAELERNDGYIDTVSLFLDMAIKIGEEGEYGETQFIKEYATHFKSDKNQFPSSKSDNFNVPTELQMFPLIERETSNPTLYEINNSESTLNTFINDTGEYEYTDKTTLKSVNLPKHWNPESQIEQTRFSRVEQKLTNEFYESTIQKSETSVKHLFDHDKTALWDKTCKKTIIEKYDTVPKLSELMEKDDYVLKSLNIQKIEDRNIVEADETHVKSSKFDDHNETAAKSSFESNTRPVLKDRGPNKILKSTANTHVILKLSQRTMTEDTNGDHTILKSPHNTKTEETIVKFTASIKENSNSSVDKSSIHEFQTPNLESYDFQDIHGC